MAQDPHVEMLDTVYAAASTAEVAASYDAWAESYDAEMASLGYRHPAICLGLVCRHLPRDAAPILDAGAGTGLIGEWLRLLGYGRTEALDISEGMLRVAGRKKIYAGLHHAALGGPLPFADNTYAGVVSAGVFTTGHVGVEGLEELIRVTRPGGVLVLTVKDTIWELGFAPRMRDLCDAGVLELIEQTPPYVSMPGRPATIPGRGVALRVL